jgi:L-ribulose-5-phosphate 3-epimerase
VKKAINYRCLPADLPFLHRARLARTAGYDAVEINLEGGTEFDLDASEGALRNLAGGVRELDLEVCGVYSREQWRSPITSADPDTRRQGEKIVERLVRAANLLATDTVLVLPGAVDNGVFAPVPEIVDYEVAYGRSQDSLTRLSSVASTAGVCLAVENIWNKFLLSPLEMRRFIDEIASDHVAVYFDVGNVMLYGFPEQWIRILGARIRRVHVKDFKRAVGTLDGFTGLLQGDVDWPAVRAALRHVGYDGYVTVEVLPPYGSYPEQLAFDASHALDRWLADEQPLAAGTTGADGRPAD